MNNEELKEQAKKAYIEMGRALGEFMGMPGGLLPAEPLMRAQASNNKDTLIRFIDACNEAAQSYSQLSQGSNKGGGGQIPAAQQIQNVRDEIEGLVQTMAEPGPADADWDQRDYVGTLNRAIRDLSNLTSPAEAADFTRRVFQRSMSAWPVYIASGNIEFRSWIHATMALFKTVFGMFRNKP